MSLTITTSNLPAAAPTGSLFPPLRSRARTTSLDELSVEVLAAIVLHLAHPTSLLRSCKTLQTISKDPTVRAKWLLKQIRGKLNVPPPMPVALATRIGVKFEGNERWERVETDSRVLMGLMAFLVGVKWKIVTDEVVGALELLGMKFPSSVRRKMALPPPAWQGWMLIARAIATRGGAATAKLAIDLKCVRDWRVVMEAAEGCGNREVVAVVIEYLRNVQLGIGKGKEKNVGQPSPLNVTSPGTYPTPLATPPMPLSPSTTTDPYLTHAILNHTTSPYLLLPFLRCLPASSPVLPSLIPTLLTSPTLTSLLPSVLETHPLPAHLLLSSSLPALLSDNPLSSTLALSTISRLVKLKHLDMVEAGSAGTMIIRRACLDGKIDVVETLVGLGAVVDFGCVESAKLGGCQRCLKVVRREMSKKKEWKVLGGDWLKVPF